MSKKSFENPKPTAKTDDLAKSKTKTGKTELTEQDLGEVTGGYQTGGSGKQ